MHQVISRRNFWNDAAKFFMLGSLGCDFASEQLRAGVAITAAQNRDCRFVAGGFQRQNCHVERSRDISNYFWLRRPGPTETFRDSSTSVGMTRNRLTIS